MSHRDSITEPPPGFTVLAASGGAPVAAMEDRERGFYAVQFHPEVVHTPKGMDVLRNFLYKACGCAPTFTPASIIEESIKQDPRPGRRQQGHPAACPAASTPPSRRCSCTRPSATGSPACSSTRA